MTSSLPYLDEHGAVPQGHREGFVPGVCGGTVESHVAHDDLVRHESVQCVVPVQDPRQAPLVFAAFDEPRGPEHIFKLVGYQVERAEGGFILTPASSIIVVLEFAQRAGATPARVSRRRRGL